jgi:acyl dehydratase
MNLQHVIERRFPPVEQRWDWKDCALYALGIGYGTDPLDERELDFVYEQRAQQVVPSFALVLGWPALWHQDPAAGIDWTRILHGEQRLVLHRPMTVSGAIVARYKIVAVQDKGPGRGALLWFDTDLEDAATGAPVAHLRNTQFLRGEGGCGDWGEPVEPLPAITTEAKALHHVDYPTLRQQALLYRLSGDTMPLHADPAVARRGGFEQPILHGLANMGMACRAILERFCPSDPARLAGMSVRFVAPAYPGETLRVEFVEDAQGVRFRARSVERDLLLLDRGSFSVRAA